MQGRYRIVRQLGKGGMGAVYEALDLRLDATVALKETFSVDNRLRKQFEQEARLLAQLNHPALPRVSDYFTEGDRAFLVMQFISGVDLAEIIAKQPGPFPRNQVVAWADQLLDALIYLHTRDRQIIHRDIKPHNLKLTAAGKIALLDFGLAKTQSTETGETTNSIFGYTRRYAPLEQIQDQGTSPQSDIYALGATLYHLLTGTKPADAIVRAAATGGSMPDPLRPADEIHPAVGHELASILCRAMAQNPEDRYQSATAFREALWRLGRNDADDLEHSGVGTVVMKLSAPLQGSALSLRARSSDPFDSYSILKPEEAAWFLPRPSRNPNPVIAGFLLVILVGLVGSLYAFRQESGAAASSSTATTSGQQRLNEALVQPGRSGRARLNTNSIGISPNGPSGISEGREARPLSNDTERKDARTERHSFTINNPNLQSLSPLINPERRVPANTRVNLPPARLSGVDPKVTEPAPVIHGLPAFAQAESVIERQVLRTPDGTQVVKFSDGTTRAFRPGEKSTPGISPR